MKLGKTAWLILIIGVFIIAIGSLYWLYLQERPKQEELSQTLSRTQALLPLLAADRTKLEDTLTEVEDKLTQATSQLETAKAAFPNSVQSIEVDELLFGLADDWDLEVVSLFATEPSDETVAVEVEESEVEDLEVEDITYLVTYFSVELKGQVADILSFVDTVVNHRDFTAATVEMVTITVPDPVSEKERAELSEDEIEERETPSAIIKLIIYTYKGE